MAQKVNKDIFKNAEALRDKVTKEQQAYITAMYKKWADDLAERAKEFQKKSNGSATVEQMYYQQLRKMVQEESQQVANGVYLEITDSMNKVSDAIVSDMVEWTKSFGFEGKGVDAAFANVSGSVVNSILTGSVYGEPGSWSLSKSIWGDNEKTLRDIYAVMAQGVAENLPISDIADMLSKYVNPSKELAWKGPNGATLYKKKVDYNAQRLARTLTQHTYQQSMVSSAKDNPFVKKFRWVSNGSRVCNICMARDGKLFNKDEVPLDHPNGQCILEPVIQDNYIDQLANWVKADDGKYPEIDAYAKKLGYNPQTASVPNLSLNDIKKQYTENIDSKLPGKWFKSLPKDVQNQVTKYHHETDLGWKAWYQKYIYKGGQEAVENIVDKTKVSVAKSVNDTANKFNKTVKKAAKQVDNKVDDAIAAAKKAADDLKDELNMLKIRKGELQTQLKELEDLYGKDSLKNMRQILDQFNKNGQGGIERWFEKNYGWQAAVDWNDELMQVARQYESDIRKVAGKKLDTAYKNAVNMSKKFNNESYMRNYYFSLRSNMLFEYYLDSHKLSNSIESRIDDVFTKYVGMGKTGYIRYNGLNDDVKSLTNKINIVNKQHKVQVAISKGAKKEFAGKSYDEAMAWLKNESKSFYKNVVLKKSDEFTDALNDILEKSKKSDIAKAFNDYSSGKIKSEKFDSLIDLLEDYKAGKIESDPQFTPDQFTDAVKKLAKDYRTRNIADKDLRKYLDDIWDDFTDEQKLSVWQYTHNSHPINRPLSGYDGAWGRDNFVGIGNIKLDNETLTNYDAILEGSLEKFANIGERRKYSSIIKDLTGMLDETVLEDSMYLYRGSDYNGLAGWFEGAGFDFQDMKAIFENGTQDELDKLEDMVIQNHAFTSTAIANDGSGFDGSVKYRIYAPKGTHGIYAEPQSFFGATINNGYKLYKKGQKYDTVGLEAEVILQRGTEYRVVSIKRKYGELEVELEIVEQPDYFETGYEMTTNNGASVFEH